MNAGNRVTPALFPNGIIFPKGKYKGSAWENGLFDASTPDQIEIDEERRCE
jgi:hypothetical protein